MRNFLYGALICPLLFGATCVQAAEMRIDFEDAKPGATPAGFAISLTGQGGPPVWITQKIGDGQVLTQTTQEDKSYRFPLCIRQDVQVTDVDLSVRFMPIAGKIDQAGGLVWRYQNADNYYVVRANALESNVVLYKVEKGRRSDLKPTGGSFGSYGKKARVTAKQWNTLRVVVRGSRFGVWLNDEHLFDVDDQTFQGEGRVGLWTKADSLTYFDDLVVKTNLQ